MPYRSWSERREIIRSVVADSNPQPLETFQLNESEKVFFRARSARAVDKLARQTSGFRAYYHMPVARPFRTVVLVSATTIVTAVAVAAFFYAKMPAGADTSAIVGPTLAVIVAAVGWAVSSGLTHRNTIRQSTNNLLFARFSQATFGEAMHRFFSTFQEDERISSERLKELKISGEDGRKATASVSYLLNYFEFIASGVLKGDLDRTIVRDNIRGVICYYYDRCEPHIQSLNRQNPRTFEFLIKLRTHYREP